MNRRSRFFLLRISGFLLVFALWAVLSLIIGSDFLPLPWQTILDSAALLAVASTWINISLTLLRIAIGFSIAFFFGALIGLLRGTWKPAEIVSDPLVHFFQGVPPILWVFPILFIAGFGFMPPILVIILITLPLVIVTTGEGMKTLPRDLREMLSLFAPRPSAYARELIFPHLTPALSSSLKLGIGLAVKSSIIAEFFGAGDGVGFMVNTAFQAAQIRRLYAWGLIIIIIIFCSDFLIKLMLSAVIPDREKRRARDERFAKQDVKIKTDAETKHGTHLPCKISGVDFSFPRPTQRDLLLKKIDLTVAPGEIAVISGDSGIGKTTLLKLIAGLLKPHSGLIVANRAAVSFMFQEDRLLPERTVRANIALPLRYRGHIAEVAGQRTDDLLERVGLSDARFLFPDELSGGMKRRAALARCFAEQPGLLLLDEPFHGLHKKARSELWEVFLSLWNESPCPVVIVTHDPEAIPRAPFLKYYRLEGQPARLVRNNRQP